MWAAVLVGVMSLGPVLVMNGEPFSARGLAFRFPILWWSSYLCLINLTLLYRLSGYRLCTIGFAVSHWRIKYQWHLCLLAILETLILSPVRFPACTDVSSVMQLSILDESPLGVGFYPLAGGRPYMASQIWHGKPLATTLNFPANSGSLRVLETMRENESVSDSDFRTVFEMSPKVVRIRYWIVDMDESMMPDEYFKGVLRMKETFPVLLHVEQPTRGSHRHVQVCGIRCILFDFGSVNSLWLRFSEVIKAQD